MLTRNVIKRKIHKIFFINAALPLKVIKNRIFCPFAVFEEMKLKERNSLRHQERKLKDEIEKNGI